MSIFDNYLLTKKLNFVMKIKELSPSILSVLKNKRYDRIVEKHEGPETWDWQLPYDDARIEALKSMYKNSSIDISVSNHADFIQIDNVDVLLPVGSDHHPNIKILHHFFQKIVKKLSYISKIRLMMTVSGVLDLSLFAINTQMNLFMWLHSTMNGILLIMILLQINLKK
jgi:hypothetical protein